MGALLCVFTGILLDGHAARIGGARGRAWVRKGGRLAIRARRVRRPWEQSRLIGHPLQQGRIEVILLYFSRSHGIRIKGGRFLTNIGYPTSIVLRNAAHEPLHPPYDANDPRVGESVAEFAKDSLVVRIVRNHNPSFGYTTLTGYVEEDCVQALEQVLSERLE